MKNRLVFILLTLALLLCLFPSFASADESGQCGDDLYWSFNSSTGTLTITGSGAMTNYSGSYSVPWYSYRTSVRQVVLPDDLTGIGSYAFIDCTGLTSIAIPHNVTTIGSNAFYGCTGLTSVIIPDNVTSIGTSAFEACTGLTSVSIGKGITTISSEVFENCTQLTSITIPDDVASIGMSAFSGCTGLTSLTVPCSTAFDNNSFSGCRALTDIHLTKGTGTWATSSYTNTPWYINRANALTITLDEDLTSIGKKAFYGCTGFTSFTVPKSATLIDNYAFAYCTGLTSITIPDSVTSIGEQAFFSCTGLTSFTIPDGVTSIGTSVFAGCTGLTSIAIPHNVTTIGSNAFYGCTGLTSVTIPDNVTSIGTSAFEACTGLTSVSIGKGITTISSEVFENCTQLTSITIPDDVASIGMSAFSGCTGLTSLTVPCSTAFDNNSFSGCRALTDIHLTKGTGTWATSSYTNTPWYINRANALTITLEEGFASIGNSVFSGCTGLTSFTIPDSVTSIGDNAFYGCTGLTSITIPDGVTSIGSYTFAYCTGLTSFTIPDSVTSSGMSAFAYCTGLTSVTILGGGTGIGLDAFRGCTGLTSVTIGDGITSIGNGVFAGCTGLTSITIPHSVNSIGANAFSGCTGITSITIQDSVTSIGDSAFYNCSGLTDVYYLGTQRQKTGITFGTRNDPLNNATWHCLHPISIEMAQLPDLLIYRERTDALNVAGGKITAHFENGVDETEVITLTMVSGFDNTTVGIQTLTVTFENKVTTFDITVNHVPAETVRENAVDATCTEEGGYDEVVYCSVCGEELSRVPKTIPALGHDLFHHDAKAPTCTEIGWEAYDTCAVCDYTTYVELPALGHDLIHHEAKEPTCTEIGWEAYDNCSRCDYSTCVEHLALGHDLVHHEAKVPTCTEIGWEAYDTCTRCAHTTYVEIPPTGHDWDTPTYVWVEDGSGWKCTATCICKNDTSHVETETVTAVEEGETPATCTAAGFTRYTATFASTAFTKQTKEVTDAPALGHEYVHHGAQVATCTAIGWDAYDTCTRCDHTTYVEIPALGHDLVHHDAKAATCTDIGWDSYDTCERCDYTTYVPLSALGHMEEIDAEVAPTCTKTGLTEGKHCSRCGEVLVAQEDIPALGHDLVHHEGKEATWSDSGWEAYDTCTRCNYTTYVKTPALKLQTFVGHWSFTKSVNGNVVIPAESLNRIMTLDFYEGGSVRFRTNDNSVSMNWTLSGSKVYLEVGNTTYFTLVYSNEMLLMVQNSSTFVFEKSPIIFNQPKDTTVCEGKKAIFAVKASGTGLAYQWYSRSTPDSAWTAVKNGTKATLNVTAKRNLDGSQYYCRIRNAVGVEGTNVVTLNVTLEQPVVKTQPKNVKAKSGSKVKMTVKATGLALSYQWFSRPNADAEWAEIEGATAATYTFVPWSEDDGWQFRCRVSNSGGVAWSDAGTLTVTPQPAEVKSPLKDVKAKSGSKPKFTVKAGGPGLSYQWYSRPNEAAEWEEIEGATAATYTFVPWAVNDGWQFRCHVWNPDGDAWSNEATLIVTAQPAEVKTSPKDAKAKSGSKPKFTVKAAGPDVEYQWYSRPNADGEWAEIEGATAATYTFTPWAENDGWQFRCHVWNPDGDQWSDEATLTVTPQPASVKTSPKDAKVKLGAKAKFTVKGVGPDLRYQWYTRASEDAAWVLIDGATKAEYTVNAAEDNIGSQYRCHVWNPDGDAWSDPTTLLLK